MPPLYVPSDTSDSSSGSLASSRSSNRDASVSEGSKWAPTQKRRRRRVRETRGKLSDILDILETHPGGLYELLSKARKASEAEGIGRNLWGDLLEKLQNDDVDSLRPHLATEKLDTRNENARGVRWDNEMLRNEVQAVGRSAIFSQWTEQDPIHFFATKLPEAIAAIGKNAPQLSEILRLLIVPVGGVPREEKQGSLVSFFSILCHAQQPQNYSNIPTQMSFYLHANGVNKSVIQTLHRMGVCVNYDVSFRKFSTRGKYSGQWTALGNGTTTTGLGYAKRSLQNTSNGGNPPVVDANDTGDWGPGRPRVHHFKTAKGNSLRANASTDSTFEDATVLDQQLGVHSTTSPKMTSEAQLKVRQPNAWHSGMRTTSGQPASDDFPAPNGEPTTSAPAVRPGRGSCQRTPANASGFRSAVLSEAATERGFGILVPPHRTAPPQYRNHALPASSSGSGANGRGPSRSSTTPAIPLPPLPPALTHPILPQGASPQEQLQYAMIAHNHSRLNQWKG